MTDTKKRPLLFLFLILLSIVFVAPVIIVLMNSFKGQFYISSSPFDFPDEKTFAGLVNYTNGIKKIKLFQCIFLFTYYYGFLCCRNFIFYFDDSMVYNKMQKLHYNYTLLYVCIQHDRTFSDGHVYYVKNSKHVKT